MPTRLRRLLFGSTGRSVVYLVVGAALFCFVLDGVYRTVLATQTPPVEPAVEVVKQAPEPDRPERYVPPAKVTYPFY